MALMILITVDGILLVIRLRTPERRRPTLR
jgi:hypothetical protein